MLCSVQPVKSDLVYIYGNVIMRCMSSVIASDLKVKVMASVQVSSAV